MERRARSEDVAAGPTVSLRQVSLAYSTPAGSRPAVELVNVDVQAGEIVAFVGPSGCGKSSLLNLVAGIVKPTTGEVWFRGATVEQLNRDVSYMTQKDTLLPWRNVLQNAVLPLEVARNPRRERRERAVAILDEVGLSGFESYRLHEISGGMRSRLSVARALLSDAHAYLMDEPFAALDALLRIKMQQLLVDMWEADPKAIMYVTHDLAEAICLAHRIVVLTHRPATVKAIRSVPVRHPRQIAEFRSTDQFADLYRELWSLLESELTTPDDVRVLED